MWCGRPVRGVNLVRCHRRGETPAPQFPSQTMTSRLPLLLYAVLLLSLQQCQKQEDPRIQNLQKDVTRLKEENQRLQNKVEDLQIRLNAQSRPQSVPSKQPEKAAVPEMTVEMMKKQIEPLLQEVIKKAKPVSDPSEKSNQFRMRVEYDLKSPIYGLVRNEDPTIPYWAKVIVRYEKFLESSSVSRSYGTGSIQFLFAYTNDRWVLINYQ